MRSRYWAGSHMPWRNAQSVPFTRIDVVAHVPAASGVFAIMDGDACLLVAESWNLKGRLLELANVLEGFEDLHIIYDLCAEEERADLKAKVSGVLMSETASPLGRRIPGLTIPLSGDQQPA